MSFTFYLNWDSEIKHQKGFRQWGGHKWILKRTFPWVYLGMWHGLRLCIELTECKKVIWNVLNSEQQGNEDGWSGGWFMKWHKLTMPMWWPRNQNILCYGHRKASQPKGLGQGMIYIGPSTSETVRKRKGQRLINSDNCSSVPLHLLVSVALFLTCSLPHLSRWAIV